MKIKSTVVDSHDKTRHGIHNSVLECIGCTPIVKLSRMGPSNAADVYVKMECENPGGSLKDRLAIGIIEWAEQHGKLYPGQTVVEASSGNTGIGLAMVCAAKGYNLVVVMSEAYSVERRKLMRFYGAQVILTSRKQNATGMLLKAKALADEHGFFYCNQFESEANAWIHENTTGREIVEAFEESQIKLDHIVIPFGTGGTVAGISRKIRQWSPKTTINLCEPSSAPMLYSGIDTVYPDTGEPSTSFETSHPAYNPHLMQGWAVDFIPKILAEAKKSNAYDKILHVDGKEAIMTSRDLAKKEGILTGISGGGTLSAALELAKTLPAGTSVLAVIADTGERYLSTSLFDGIPSEMTPEESYLDATTIPKDPLPVALPEPTPEAVQLVQNANESDVVVLWCLQHTDGSTTMQTFLGELKMQYKTIYLDDFEFAKDNMGGQCKSVLEKVVGSTALPQLFVGGQLVGGIDDTFALWCNGTLAQRLEVVDVAYASHLAATPGKCLPEWAVQQFLRQDDEPNPKSPYEVKPSRKTRSESGSVSSKQASIKSRSSGSASTKSRSSASSQTKRHKDHSTQRRASADSPPKGPRSWKLPSLPMLKTAH